MASHSKTKKKRQRNRYKVASLHSTLVTNECKRKVLYCMHTEQSYTHTYIHTLTYRLKKKIINFICWFQSVFLFILKIIIDSTSYWPRKHLSLAAVECEKETIRLKMSKGEAKIIIK